MNSQKVSLYRIIGNVVGNLGLTNVSNYVDDLQGGRKTQN